MAAATTAPTGNDGTTGTGGPAGGDGNQGGGTNNGGSTVGTVPVATTPGAKAHISSDGHTAVAPANAPAAVQEIIAAANEITNTHYRWGGGHGSFNDTAYDCSGAVSHALHGASLLTRPLDSTDFESWGESRPREVGHGLRELGPRLSGGGGPALRHVGERREGPALAQPVQVEPRLRRRGTRAGSR